MLRRNRHAQTRRVLRYGRKANRRDIDRLRRKPLHITPTSHPSVPNCPALNLNNRQEFILPRVSSPNVNATIDLADIRSAAARIQPYVHRTPLLASRSLSERLGVEVRLKCENLQRAGSFKIRGAMNALLQVDEARRSRGVVAFSSGNHAQGVALAARLLGMPATIVMPENSVRTKVLATQAYGAEVVQAGVT